MISIGVGEHGKAEAGYYRVAGQEVDADIALPALAPFAAPSPGESGRSCTVPSFADLDGDVETFRGDAWLAEDTRFVECRRSSAGYTIDVEGVGSLSVGASGDSVVFGGYRRAIDDAVHQLLLGPGLILALSLRGTYCLHASAVASNGGVAAFLGESGAGKSTLAGFLAGSAGSGWRAVADDLLPVALDERGLWALPRYPQLKLPVGHQPSLPLPERMPVHSVYLLENAPSGRAVSLRALSGVDGALALVEHTVAAKLFDRDLLARHLRFCVGAAAAIDVRRLSFHRKRSELAAMRSVLEDEAPRLRSTCEPMALEPLPV